MRIYSHSQKDKQKHMLAFAYMFAVEHNIELNDSHLECYSLPTCFIQLKTRTAEHIAFKKMMVIWSCLDKNSRTTNDGELQVKLS